MTNILLYKIMTNTNLFMITQFQAHKNNLPYMFQDPMEWCDENIDILST